MVPGGADGCWQQAGQQQGKKDVREESGGCWCLWLLLGMFEAESGVGGGRRVQVARCYRELVRKKNPSSSRRGIRRRVRKRSKVSFDLCA